MTVPRPAKATAFSLIELLIVLALMIIMVTMLYSFSSPVHQRTQKELCSDNLQKIYLAMQLYANDFGKYPANKSAATSEDVLKVLVPRYTADTSIFICPGGRDAALSPGAPISGAKISYAYYMGRTTNDAADFLMSDRQINTSSKNTGDQVFSLDGKAPGNNHSKFGGNILFSDGSVQTIAPVAPFSLAFSKGIVLLNPKP